MLLQEEEALQKQKEQLDKNLARARVERQQLRRDREKHKAKLLQEKEKQIREWEKLQEEKRYAEQQQQNYHQNLFKEKVSYGIIMRNKGKELLI